MAHKLARPGQKASGIWYVDLVGPEGRRHRISTGIKTEKRRTPPMAVRDRAKEIYFAVWSPEAVKAAARKRLDTLAAVT
jgi:hypothetical protein